jgi:hypothetical protein
MTVNTKTMRFWLLKTYNLVELYQSFGKPAAAIFRVGQQVKKFLQNVITYLANDTA